MTREGSGEEIVLRPLELGDEKALVEFINALVEEKAPILMNEKQTLEGEREYVAMAIKQIAEGKRVQLLAVVGEQVVGNCQIEKGTWKEGHVGEFGISISAECRGQGLGERLAQAVIEEAGEKLGIELINLEVFASNEQAMGLYRKLGFVEYGRLPGGVRHRSESIDRVLMYRKV